MSLKYEHAYSPVSQLIQDCAKCGYPERYHRAKRTRVDVRERGYRKRYVRPRTDRIIGVDGEGLGRRPHRYTYLAAGDEKGWTADVKASPGGHLSSVDALNFLVSLPDRALIVSYAFFYDVTKILQDLPDEAIWYLLHEDKRGTVVDGRIIYRHVQWQGFRLNFMNRRFTVQQGKKSVTLWDVFAFFQGKFTTALKDWKVGTEDERAEIERMKDQRSTFEELNNAEIESYCRSECKQLAQLVRRVLDAHKAAGLVLKNYYGAGSSAKAVLNTFQSKTYMAQPSDGMRHAVACSFFGGRFENSVHGPIEGPIYNYDISSAYPYQITQLPCLAHGTWEHVKNPSISRIERAALALLHWHTPNILKISDQAFGPWPVRAKTGTIAFPLSGLGGWTWKKEFLAGLKLAPNAIATEGWFYETECACEPFRDIPALYRERVKLGKDGPGIVLKLALNAIYGSLAQSKGLSPPFQCWIWAANITSGTRAQLIDAICCAKNTNDILTLATDGISSKFPLTLAKPVDTGTGDLPKPLGGWEAKEPYASGIFCARPGISFPLNPTDDQLKEVRARGIGKKVLYEKWPLVVRAWSANATSCRIVGIQRFVGAKSAIHRSRGGFSRSADYGEWVNHTIEVSFAPAPKRMGFGDNQRLKPWHYFDWESEPYKEAIKSPEAQALAQAELIAMEQPDSEFLDGSYAE